MRKGGSEQEANAMIRAKVVYLLVPTGHPEVLTDKLDRVERVAEQGSVTTQSVRRIKSKTCSIAGAVAPLHKARAHVESDGFQACPHALVFLVVRGRRLCA